MSDLDKLEQTWRDLEAKAQQIMADKDEAIAKVRERYADKQRQANQAPLTLRRPTSTPMQQQPCWIAPMGQTSPPHWG
jgi:hypothetical protein